VSYGCKTAKNSTFWTNRDGVSVRDGTRKEKKGFALGGGICGLGGGGAGRGKTGLEGLYLLGKREITQERGGTRTSLMPPNPLNT
jgi:hypothetical protein